MWMRSRSASIAIQTLPSIRRRVLSTLMMQPRDKVRAFLIKYQDRVLYGTDLVVMPTDDTKKALAEWNDTYARDWKFFATNKTLLVRGRKVQGLELPEPVLRKLYHDNAVRWFSGAVGGANAP